MGTWSARCCCISGSPPVGVYISHLHWDACHLRRPSDRNAQRHFLPFFLYLENDNSYCCYYKERHFVFFSLLEKNVLKLTELCSRKKEKKNWKSKMTSTECVGWRGKGVLFFYPPAPPFGFHQSGQKRWIKKKKKKKKKQNHTNSQKRDLYFFFSFFLDFNKSGEQRGLQFCVMLFLPCDSLQLKNKTLARPSMVSHSTRVRRRTR